MRKPGARWSIRKGATYGIGSLEHRPRTVVDIVDGGRTVHWLAENPPPTTTIRTASRTPGRVYSCSRDQFVSWLRAVEKEIESYYKD
jgi:hypothetical protein